MGVPEQYNNTSPQAPLNTMDDTETASVNGPSKPHNPVKTQQPRRWLRWQFLVIYGTLIAVISAVIGGLAAKSIVEPKPSKPKPFEDDYDLYCKFSRDTPVNMAMAFPADEPFQVHCGVHWNGNDIAALYAENSTICAEACYQNKENSALQCIGASFVPKRVQRFNDDYWRNRYENNCWLKYNSTGPGDHRGDGERVLAICLERDCLNR